MGSRPSSNCPGSNGTISTQAETDLRNENNQLKEKLAALEELQPIQPTMTKQENEELRRVNKELTTELEVLRKSILSRSRQSNTDPNDHPDASQISKHDTKERDRSTRRINSTLVSKRLSDIDAYGQGIPLEKHPPLKIKGHRKKRKKIETSLEVGELKPKETFGKYEHLQKINAKDGQDGKDKHEILTSDKDLDIMTSNKQQFHTGQDKGVSMGVEGLATHVEYQDKESCQGSDLLS